MIKHQLFIISIANPIIIGLYKDKELIDTISQEGKTSDILPIIIDDILKTKTIDEIYFVNGPGSYMAIKVAYIFLKTFCQIKNIPLFACSGFKVNNNSPIKALGKKYFFQKENKEIQMRFLEKTDILIDFKLPESLNPSIFSMDTLPNYQLPAV